MPKTTDFGFEKISTHQKGARVKSVFDSVSKNYDLMNDLMSFGIHRLWKHIAVSACGIQKGDIILDLAGGTGDLAARYAKKIGEQGCIYLADINLSMLLKGKRKLSVEKNFNRIRFIQLNGEKLPFLENCFDLVSIGFGLRNFTDKQKGLKEMFRILKPGGRLMILEFSQPTNPYFRSLYDLYSFQVLPKMGEIVCQDSKAYQYLAESIRMHPTQAVLANLLQQAGFTNVSFKNLTNGIVAIHQGVKG